MICAELKMPSFFVCVLGVSFISMLDRQMCMNHQTYGEEENLL